MGWRMGKIQEGKSKLERAFQGGNRIPKDEDDMDWGHGPPTSVPAMGILVFNAQCSLPSTRASAIL